MVPGVVLALGALISIGMRSSQDRDGTGATSSAAVGRLLGANANEGLGRLEGVMVIGLCPPAQAGKEPAPPPRCTPTPELYALHKAYLLSEDEALYTLMPDKDGNFSSMLPPGTYVADIDHNGVGKVSGVPAAVVIEKGEVATLLIGIDKTEK